jgi:hypothetical protein
LIKNTCTFQGSKKGIPRRNDNNNENRSFMYIGCVNHYAILIFMKYMHSRISYFDRMEKQIRDDVLSLNNSKFGDFVDRIYPIELTITDTTDTA